MVLVLDAWQSENLAWLDGGSCEVPERCNLASTRFTNISIKALESQAPPSDGCPGKGWCGCDSRALIEMFVNLVDARLQRSGTSHEPPSSHARFSDCHASSTST